jgi:hypothetical protein
MPMPDIPVTTAAPQLIELAAIVAAMRTLPASDTEGRKALETEFGVHLQANEQLLRHRELLLKETAQGTDAALRRDELTLKENTARKEKWTNPLTVGVIVAAFGLIGNFANGLWTNINQRDQLENQRTAERIKLENDLIKEAIKPAAEEDRAKNLVFFANNGLIRLEDKDVASLIKVAGSARPVPASSSLDRSATAAPLVFAEDTVVRIASNKGKGVPPSQESKISSGLAIKAIILHDAVGPDSSEKILRSGLQGIPGPLTHWLVKSDGTIIKIAPETTKANHIGLAKNNLKNNNTIGIHVTGSPALQNPKQAEALVQLVMDISKRWELTPDQVLSHAEVGVPAGRKTDMLQQAPVVREMFREALARQQDAK